MSDKPLAFVLMPMSAEFDTYFEDFIQPTLENAGYLVERADTRLHQQNILRTIIKGVSHARLIVADLTASNPNVFYELGIAHAKGKQTVLITQSIEELPFDLRSYNAIAYGTDYRKVTQFRERLEAIAQGALGDEVEFGNPVTDFWDPPPDDGTPARIKPNEPQDGDTDEEPQPEENGQAATDTEKGIWDWAADAEESLNYATDLTKNLVASMETLSQRVTKRGEEMKQLAGSKEPGTALKIRQSITIVANHLMEFDKDVKSGLSPFHSAWQRVEENLMHLLTRVEGTPDETRVLGEYRTSIEDLEQKISGTITSVESLRGSLRTLKGISRDLNFAVEQNDRTMAELVEEYRIVQSIAQRIIARVDELGVPSSRKE